MRIRVYRTESDFNRATRKREQREILCGEISLPSHVELGLKWLAPEYRMNIAEFVGMVLAYYLGDGHNHFGCAYCDWWREGECLFPAQGEQTTIPT